VPLFFLAPPHLTPPIHTVPSYQQAHSTIKKYVHGCGDLYAEHFLKVAVHAGVIYRRDFLGDSVISSKLLSKVKDLITEQIPDLVYPISGNAVMTCTENYASNAMVPLARLENEFCDGATRTTRGYDIVVPEQELSVFDPATGNFHLYTTSTGNRNPRIRSVEDDRAIIERRIARTGSEKLFFHWYKPRDCGLFEMLQWTKSRIDRHRLVPEELVFYSSVKSRKRTDPESVWLKYEKEVQKKRDAKSSIVIPSLSEVSLEN